LVALRENLLEWLDEAPADRKAALVSQYRATLAEIDELTPKEAVGDGIDEIARRRAARRSSSAKGSGSAKRTS
jgi:Mor family transcriptional regulator